MLSLTRWVLVEVFRSDAVMPHAEFHAKLAQIMDAREEVVDESRVRYYDVHSQSAVSYNNWGWLVKEVRYSLEALNGQMRAIGSREHEIIRWSRT